MKTNLDALIQECKQDIHSAKETIANAEQKLVFVIEAQSKQAQTIANAQKNSAFPEIRKSRVSEILPPKNSNTESSTTDLIINNHKIAFTKQDNQTFCTSLDIAKVFEKRHADILENIRMLHNDTDTNMRNFNERNFRLVKYKDEKGEMRPCYKISRDGFSFVAMGLTGANARKWKIAFINAFNTMEESLKAQQSNQESINVSLKQYEALFNMKFSADTPAKEFILKSIQEAETKDKKSSSQNNSITGITITSLEIAELTGKEHKHIMRDIRETLGKVVLGGVSKFGHTYTHPQNKQEIPYYRLPKREALILVSGYSVELRAKIIDRLEYLENQVMSRILNNQQENKNTINESLKQYEALFNMKFSADTPAKEFILKSIQEAETKKRTKVEQVISYKYTEEFKKGKIVQGSEIGLKYAEPIKLENIATKSKIKDKANLSEPKMLEPSKVRRAR